jgi:hypothetical protein
MSYKLITTSYVHGFIGAPAAFNRLPHITELFIRGNDNKLYQKSCNYYTWTDWVLHDDGLQLGSEPSLCSSGSEDLHVFARGYDGALYHKYWTETDGWHAWESLGGKIIGRPAAICRDHVTMDIFARGTDNRLWQKCWDGERWLNWILLDNTLILGSAPAVCSTGHLGLNVFVRKSDGQLWHKPWTGENGWHPGEPLGGQIIVDPFAIAGKYNGRVVPVLVVAVGTDGKVWIKFWDGDAWKPWLGLESLISGSPSVYGGLSAVIHRYDGTLHLFTGGKEPLHIKELMLLKEGEEDCQHIQISDNQVAFSPFC